MKNKFKVSKKQWKKWNKEEQTLFNTLYEFSKVNSWVFRHPKASIMTKDHWNTVAWNHAWMAADLAKEIRKSHGE